MGFEYHATPVTYDAGDPVEALTDISGRVIVSPLDPSLAIPMGLVAGMSSINKFGENPDIASTTTEEVWDGSAAYSYPATALMTSMSQTADQELMRSKTIELQGLDANWALVTQTKALDATLTTNVVTLDTPMIRVFRMKVLANVVSASPIRCHNAGESQDYAIIQTGNNQTLMALYTVPADTTAYMTAYYGDAVVTAAKNPKNTEFKVWAADRANTYEFQLKHMVAITEQSARFQHRFDPYLKFTEKTDIKITARPEDKDVTVHAGFDLILVDD